MGGHRYYFGKTGSAVAYDIDILVNSTWFFGTWIYNYGVFGC